MAVGKPRGKDGKRPVYTYDPRVRKKVYVGERANLNEARTLDRQKRQEFQDAFNKGQVRQTALTCREYAEKRWYSHRHGDGTKRPRPGTLKINKSQLKKFLDEYGDRPLDGVTREEALDFATKHGYNAAKTVSAMLHDAIDEHKCSTNPFARRGLPLPEGRQNIVPLTEDEVEELADIARRMWKAYGKIVAAWILFLAWVGCRPQEMANLDWPDLDISGERVRITRVKKPYKTQRVVLAHRAIRAILDMGTRPGGAVFQTIERSRLSPSTWPYYWDPVRKAFLDRLTERDPERAEAILNGRDNFDLYELRHFCGSIMADRGASARDIAHQLGNTEKVCERTYLHTHEDRANERNRGYLNVTSLDEHRKKKSA